MGKRGRRASFFVWGIFAVLGWLAVWGSPAAAWDAEGRIEYLEAGDGYSFSAPDAAGDTAVWSEKVGGIQRACFFVVGKSMPQVLDAETQLPNAEKVRVDGEMAVYRDSSKNLCFKNWKTGQKGLLAAGEISPFFRISGGKVVYFKGSSITKECVLQTIGKAGGQTLFSDSVKDMCFFNRDGLSWLVWINGSGVLKFMDINERQVREASGIRPVFGMISLWGDTLVYAESGTGKLFRVRLGEELVPEYLGIDVDAGKSFVYLYGDFVYYRMGDNICRFNMAAGTGEEVLAKGVKPLCFATSGTDFFWLDENYKLVWHAGLAFLSLEPSGMRIKKGEEREFSLKALYRNGWEEEVSEQAAWETEGEGEVYIAGGKVRGIRAGDVLVKAFYEGKEAAGGVKVVELTGLRLVPAGEAVIKKGQSLPLQLGGVYSDGAFEVVEEGIAWISRLENPVADGVYYGEKDGEDVLTACYGGLEVSLDIKVEGENAAAGGENGSGDESEGEEGAGQEESPQAGSGKENGGSEGETGDKTGEKGEDSGGKGEDAGGDSTSGSGVINNGPGREDGLPENKDDGKSQGYEGKKTKAWEDEKAVPAVAEANGVLVFELGEEGEVVFKGKVLRGLENREVIVKKDGVLIRFEGIEVRDEDKAYLAAGLTEVKEENASSAYHDLKPASSLWKLEIRKEGLADNLRCFIMLDKGRDFEASEMIAGFFKGKGDNFLYAGIAREKDGLWILEYRGDGVYGIFYVKAGFADLKGHWAKEAAEFLAVHHVVAGKKKGVFAPDEKVSRAEVAAMLVRMEEGNGGFLSGKKGEEGAGFADVSPGAWYYDAVRKAQGNSWLAGRNEKAFLPEEGITREEMAAVLYRFMGENLLRSREGESDAGFVDEDEMAPWSRQAVKELLGMGIVRGMPDGRFCPRDKLTRAQAASLLYRVFKWKYR